MKKSIAEAYRKKLITLLEDHSVLRGFNFQLLYPGGDEGLFFVRLHREEPHLEIKHDSPATIFGARDKAGLAGLAGSEHACNKRNGSGVVFDLRDDDYDFSFTVFCDTRIVRFLEVDQKTVRLQLELNLLPDEPVSMSGGARRGDPIWGEQAPTGLSKTLTLEAEGSFAEFLKEHQKFFKSLTALKKFPIDLLSIDRMDTLTLGGAGSAYEIGFAEYRLGSESFRPYLILHDGPRLPGTVAELQNTTLTFDEKPEGQMYDLYREGRPSVELLSMSFGKIKGKSIDCVLELKLGLAEIAQRNPEHRYKDATCKLKTRISVAEGFS